MATPTPTTSSSLPAHTDATALREAGNEHVWLHASPSRSLASQDGKRILVEGRGCIVKDIDGKDWYRSGAEMFIKMQLRQGGWHSKSDMHGGGGGRMGKGSPVSTAFAILFLRRKFRKTLGPITPGGGARVAQLSALSDKSKLGLDCLASVFCAPSRTMMRPLKTERELSSRIPLYSSRLSQCGMA